MEYDRVRDFLILHYHATERDDAPHLELLPHDGRFPTASSTRWSCSASAARVVTYKDGLFLEPSWLAVYFGQRVDAARLRPARRRASTRRRSTRKTAARCATQIQRAAVRMPTHEEFLRSYCPAADSRAMAERAREPASTAWSSSAAAPSPGSRRSRCSRAFRHRKLEVTVVDTGRRADAPVGRWTLALAARHARAASACAEPDFLRRTGATYKLATEHRRLAGRGQPFPACARRHRHRHRRRAVLQIPAARSDRGTAQQTRGLFAGGRRRGAARPIRAAAWATIAALTSSFTYGFHLDEARLRRASCANTRRRSGVRRVEGTFARPIAAGGRRMSRRCGSPMARRVAGDLFVDCTGRRRTHDRVDAGERDDWSAWLPCDRMARRSPARRTNPPPLTRTIAAQRRLAVARAARARHRWSGHVYGSAFSSDDAALAQSADAAPDLRATPVSLAFPRAGAAQFWDAQLRRARRGGDGARAARRRRPASRAARHRAR